MTTSQFQETSLQSLLERVAFEEGFKLPRFEIKLGSKPGDNFVGRIFRTVITEAPGTKRLSLIFKASPISSVRKEKLSTDDIFQVESDVYQLVLPTFNQLLKKFGLSHSEVFPGTARCFTTYVNNSGSDDCHALVLEDMAEEGFRMFSGKNNALDAEHCRFVLKKLALWHATSMALHVHDPQTAEKLAKHLRRDDLPFYNVNHPLFDEVVPGAQDAVNKCHEHCQIESTAYKKTIDLIRNYRTELVAINHPTPDLFCIIQGDCWTNNVMYKYGEDGALRDVCLLDLQLGRETSPVLDVVYMLCLCTTKDVRDAHYDGLIQFYHDELCSNLNKLACDPQKIIPWQLLQEHLVKYGRIGVLGGLMCLPILAADSSCIEIDLHGSHHEGNVFIGSANVTDSKQQREIWRRIADVIEDSCRWGYI